MIDAPYHEQWPTRQATERVCGGSEAAFRCLRLRGHCRDLRFCRQCHRGVCQARRAEIVSQGAVEGGDHIGHDLDGREINAVASPRDRVENLQEVFIKIKDWVWLAGYAR